MLEPGRAAGPLDGQVALITGSSSGLGKATAIALAQAGADVALLARGKDDLERAAAEVTPVGRRALVLVADLTLAEELTEAVDQMLERFGRVDVLVNAAGTDRPGRSSSWVSMTGTRCWRSTCGRRSCSPRRYSHACGRPGEARSSTCRRWRASVAGRTRRLTARASSG